MGQLLFCKSSACPRPKYKPGVRGVVVNREHSLLWEDSIADPCPPVLTRKPWPLPHEPRCWWGQKEESVSRHRCTRSWGAGGWGTAAVEPAQDEWGVF